MANIEKQQETCANCGIWNRSSNIIASALGFPRIRIPGEETIDSAYGKCRATFVDKNGDPQVWDQGTVGSTECISNDDLGNKLFTPKR